MEKAKQQLECQRNRLQQMQARGCPEDKIPEIMKKIDEVNQTLRSIDERLHERTAERNLKVAIIGSAAAVVGTSVAATTACCVM